MSSASESAGRIPLMILLMGAFLESLSAGMALANLPPLIGSVTGRSISEAASLGGWMIAGYSVSNIVASPLLAGLSDAIGRRPVLVYALFGFVLDYILLASASTVWMLMLARVAAGVAGATYAISAAYLADVTEKQNRVKAYSRLSAANAGGYIVGPAAGGLLSSVDVRLPFYVAAGLGMVTVVLAFLFLSESLPLSARQPFRWRHANPLGLLRSPPGTVGFPFAVSALAVLIFVGAATNVLWPYFARAIYGWSSMQVGLSRSFLSVLAVASLLMLPVISRRLGELITLRIAIVSYVIAMLGYTMTSNPVNLYALIAAESIGTWSYPIIVGSASLRMGADSQGAFQGQLAILNSMVGSIVPVAALWLFELGSRRAGGTPMGAGAPYVICAVLLSALLPISSILVPRQAKDVSHE